LKGGLLGYAREKKSLKDKTCQDDIRRKKRKEWETTKQRGRKKKEREDYQVNKTENIIKAVEK
jgi:hypothetical protein